MLYVNESLPISSRVIKDRSTGKVFTIAQVFLGNPENGRAIVLTVSKTLRKIQKGHESFSNHWLHGNLSSSYP